jgi:hypothetical protein
MGVTSPVHLGEVRSGGWTDKVEWNRLNSFVVESIDRSLPDLTGGTAPP